MRRRISLIETDSSGEKTVVTKVQFISQLIARQSVRISHSN